MDVGTKITDAMLLTNYVSPQLHSYFLSKHPDESPAYVEMKVVECIKFIMICGLDGMAGEITFSDEVDEIWHDWILETKEYQDFCFKLPNETYLHHSSRIYQLAKQRVLEEKKEADDSKAKAQRNLDFFSTYIKNFGHLSKEAQILWVAAEEIMTSCEWTLEKFNMELAK